LQREEGRNRSFATSALFMHRTARSVQTEFQQKEKAALWVITTLLQPVPPE